MFSLPQTLFAVPSLTVPNHRTKTAMTPFVKAFFDDATNTVSFVVQEPKGIHIVQLDAKLLAIPS